MPKLLLGLSIIFIRIIEITIKFNVTPLKEKNTKKLLWIKTKA
jgi:hypothetical protein